MPIEIKELIIKATVTDNGTPTSTPGTGNNAPASVSEESLVERCVEQVMEILRIQNER